MVISWEKLLHRFVRDHTKNGEFLFTHAKDAIDRLDMIYRP